MISEAELLTSTTSMDDCPCCNDEWSGRWCYCPPTCPDYQHGLSGNPPPGRDAPWYEALRKALES